MTFSPYCGPAPDPADLIGRWNLDPLAWAGLAVCVAFWVGLRKRSRNDGFAMAAWVVLAVAFVSPLCALTTALFSARTVHHALLVLAAAPLIAMALRGPRLLRHGVGGLALVTVVQAAVFWAWHAPALYGWALSDDLAYWLMQLSLVTSACIFWRYVLAAPALPAVLALGVSMAQMGLLGALIAFAGEPLYGPHLLTTVAWGMTPLEDQQLAGLLMWAPMALVYLGAAIARMAPLLREPGKAAA